MTPTPSIYQVFQCTSFDQSGNCISEGFGEVITDTQLNVIMIGIPVLTAVVFLFFAINRVRQIINL